jgi:hypothetical protein
MTAAQRPCDCGHQHFLSTQDAYVRSFLRLKPGMLAKANKTVVQVGCGGGEGEGG